MSQVPATGASELPSQDHAANPDHVCQSTAGSREGKCGSLSSTEVSGDGDGNGEGDVLAKTIAETMRSPWKVPPAQIVRLEPLRDLRKLIIQVCTGVSSVTKDILLFAGRSLNKK